MQKSIISTAGLFLLGFASHANAGLVFSAPDLNASLGSSGTFDILLANTGPSSVSISGFSFEITTSNAGITFTDATTGTIGAPYIFGADTLFGPDIAISTGTTLIASDNPAVAISYPVASGTTVGLGHVSYTIAGGASTGPFAITFVPSGTSLADANSANITGITLMNGQFDLTAVPEPSTFGLAALALTAAVLLKRR